MADWTEITNAPPLTPEALRAAAEHLLREDHPFDNYVSHILPASIERGAEVLCGCGCGYYFRIRDGQIEHALPSAHPSS
jgi:hypothetical protein